MSVYNGKEDAERFANGKPVFQTKDGKWAFSGAGRDPSKSRIGTGIVVGILIALGVFVLLGPSSAGIEVTKEQFGDDWAFTVDSGTVDCRKGNAAVFVSGGVAYGLNGFADAHGFADLTPIWRADPEIPGLKIGIGPFIDLALSQC